MTRYARARRDQKIQAKNSTPWSILAPKPSTSVGCEVPHNNGNERDDSLTKKGMVKSSEKQSSSTKSKEEGPESMQTAENTSQNVLDEGSILLKKGILPKKKGKKVIKSEMKKKKVKAEPAVLLRVESEIDVAENDDEKNVPDEGNNLLKTGNLQKVDKKVLKSKMKNKEVKAEPTESIHVENEMDVAENDVGKGLTGEIESEEKKLTVDKVSTAPAKKAEKYNKQHLRRFLGPLLKISELDSLKGELRRLREKEKINRTEKLVILRKWKNRNWGSKKTKAKAKGMLLEKIDADKGGVQSLEDVKQLVNAYVEEEKITRFEGASIITQWKRREARRIKRQLEDSKKNCFYCRGKGHRVSDCPVKNETEIGTGICFKCGSTEHNSSRCTRKNVQGFPYASCFVCKRRGHLSRDCPENPNGIYPDGGSCNLCASTSHLWRDCPTRRPAKEAKEDNAFAVVNNEMLHGDDDVTDAVNLKNNKGSNFKKKTVYF